MPWTPDGPRRRVARHLWQWIISMCLCWLRLLTSTLVTKFWWKIYLHQSKIETTWQSLNHDCKQWQKMFNFVMKRVKYKVYAWNLCNFVLSRKLHIIIQHYCPIFFTIAITVTFLFWWSYMCAAKSEHRSREPFHLRREIVEAFPARVVAWQPCHLSSWSKGASYLAGVRVAKVAVACPMAPRISHGDVRSE